MRLTNIILWWTACLAFSILASYFLETEQYGLALLNGIIAMSYGVRWAIEGSKE